MNTNLRDQRYAQAENLRSQGMTFAEIGREMGVSGGRARDILIEVSRRRAAGVEDPAAWLSLPARQFLFEYVSDKPTPEKVRQALNERRFLRGLFGGVRKKPYLAEIQEWLEKDEINQVQQKNF